jgi:hypothetical protein
LQRYRRGENVPPHLKASPNVDVEAEDAPALGGEIKHFMDLNESGRILLGKDQSSVPLSLWPLVLERANGLFSDWDDDEPARRANAIFHLLQGPALMQRRGGDVVHKASHLSIIGKKRDAILSTLINQEKPTKK